MSLRKCLLTTACLIVPLGLWAGEPGKLRELDAKGAKIELIKGGATKPLVITNADEFDKAIPGADAIKKQIDFGRDKMLLFAWGGSGGDKLSAKMSEDGKTATFTYSPGLTRDFRRHVHLFAVPKAAEFKIIGGRGK